MEGFSYEISRVHHLALNKWLTKRFFILFLFKVLLSLVVMATIFNNNNKKILKNLEKNSLGSIKKTLFGVIFTFE